LENSAKPYKIIRVNFHVFQHPVDVRTRYLYQNVCYEPEQKGDYIDLVMTESGKQVPKVRKYIKLG